MRNRYNSTFKVKPTVPLKRSSFLKRTKVRKTKKSSSSGLPAWIKAIPEGLHGSGTLQKRLWRLASDTARIRDWYKYDGRCVATGVMIPHWKQGDAGHWKSFSVCRGLFKFDTANIHLQSKASNGWGGQEIGHSFGEELKRRYGDDFLEVLVTLNQRQHAVFTRTA